MYLDPQIRDWVLLPIMIVMIQVGLLRHYATQLIQSTPKPLIKQLRENAAMLRSRTIRFSSILPFSSFNTRKEFISLKFTAGEYLKNPITDSYAPNPMSDPAAMEGTMEMMKNNMAKLPFPLTIRFKSMMQSGIQTKDMDVRWVSSISWYFLNLFGLTSVYTILLGDGTRASGVSDMQQMQAMGAPQPMQQPAEVAKAFKSEVEFFSLLDYNWQLKDVELRVLESFK